MLLACYIPFFFFLFVGCSMTKWLRNLTWCDYTKRSGTLLLQSRNLCKLVKYRLPTFHNLLSWSFLFHPYWVFWTPLLEYAPNMAIVSGIKLYIGNSTRLRTSVLSLYSISFCLFGKLLILKIRPWKLSNPYSELVIFF